MTVYSSWFSTVPFKGTASLVRSVDRRAALSTIVRAIEGIESVRILPAQARAPGSRDKVYVVLASHDVKRDRRVVEVLCQIDDIDFDLVPSDAQGMIPDAATPLRTLS